MRVVHAASVGLLITLALMGCAVGPTFHSPAPPASDKYTSKPLPSITQATEVSGGEAQHLQFGRDLSGEWWTLFGSAGINRLIQEAMNRYPDIAAQQAALRAAGEDVKAQRGVLFPQIDGTAAFQREKVSGASIAPGFPAFITNIYQATVNVSYTFDLFGGERRVLEQLRAKEQAQSFALEASYLTLTSNVAATAIELASLNDQIVATREIIAIETRQLDFIQRRFEAGSLTRADILQQQSNLASVRATLPQLMQQQATAEHHLAVLTGHFPHEIESPTVALSDLKLPEDLPVSLPSALVAQRPDIRAQEAVMHQASAAVGIATSNLLPQLTLTAAVGTESLRASDLFQPAAGVWNLAGGITQPVFRGGALRAKRRAAIDQYDQTRANYDLTVLKAFQNVADTLTALESDAQTLHAAHDALDAAQASLDFVKRQYDAGAVNYVLLLSAQQIYQQALLAHVKAVASRFTDTVTLFQALGGGWWNRSDPGVLQTTAKETNARVPTSHSDQLQ